jgi:hypothetical protein
MQKNMHIILKKKSRDGTYQNNVKNNLLLYLKDQSGKPERGEWMGGDKNSIQEFGL